MTPHFTHGQLCGVYLHLSTPHIKQRRLFFDASPDSKQPVGQYGSVEAAVWKNDSNTIDEVNQVIV